MQLNNLFSGSPQEFDPTVHPDPSRSQPVHRVPTLEQVIAYTVAQDIKVAPTVPEVISASELARLDRTRGAQHHVDAFNEAVATYNNLTHSISEALEVVWRASQAYATASGGNLPPHFQLNTFLSIHTPILDKASAIDAGFTTTRAHVMTCQDSFGRNW